MPSSPDELKVARSWIGNVEETAVFDERYDRLGSLGQAIEESLRSQLAAMILDQPAGLGLSDGTNLNYAANIKALTDLYSQFVESDLWLETLEALGQLGTNVVTFTKIERVHVR